MHRTDGDSWTPTLVAEPDDQHAASVRSDRKLAPLLALSLPLLVAGGDEFTQGVNAYRAGKPKEALQAFLAAERSAGEAAAPELFFDQAMAALAAGDLRRAEIAAEKAAVHGKGDFFALRDFVLGSAAFARCTRAELQASGPEAEPFAFEIAITHAKNAEAFWRLAAASRADWPQARGNVERAQDKIAELRDKKTEAQKKKDQAKKDRNKPKDPEPEQNQPAGKGKEEEASLKPQPIDAGSQELRGMLDLLVKKEKEKRDLRRSQQQLRTKPGEKDW